MSRSLEIMVREGQNTSLRVAALYVIPPGPRNVKRMTDRQNDVAHNPHLLCDGEAKIENRDPALDERRSVETLSAPREKLGSFFLVSLVVPRTAESFGCNNSVVPYSP